MNKTLGIIGAGQLALMIVQSASKFGIKCICLDPNPIAPAFKYSEEIVKDYDDIEGLKELSSRCDVIVYEFENIDLNALKVIDKSKLLMPLEVLRISKNRLLEKEFAKSNKYKVVEFSKVTDFESLTEAISKIGFPGILKTTEMGYDGKGQIVLKTQDDIMQIENLDGGEWIYEERLNFDFEMSVICVRSPNGQSKIFNPFINEHVDNILHKTRISKNTKVNEQAKKLVENIMINNDFYGILCVEMFVKDDIIYFNEMAPRPHNSGHITMDSMNVSQFEQLVRAAFGYRLLDIEIIQDMAMINVLGQHMNKTIEILKNSPYVHTYLYGKDEARRNRKMGHLNISDEELENKISLEFKNGK